MQSTWELEQPTQLHQERCLLSQRVASNDGVITENNENLNGRMSPTYAGITTTLSADILNATTDEVNITNIGNYNINIGDYLMVDDEIIV